MAKRSIADLKLFFRNGLKPPQENFWDWLDSFVHIDNFPTDKTFGLYFSMAGDEVAILLEAPFNVTSVVLGNASALLYSINNGISWITYTVPVTLPAGQIRLKVSDWNTGYDGSIIIKGN